METRLNRSGGGRGSGASGNLAEVQRGNTILNGHGCCIWPELNHGGRQVESSKCAGECQQVNGMQSFQLDQKISCQAKRKKEKNRMQHVERVRLRIFEDHGKGMMQAERSTASSCGPVLHHPITSFVPCCALSTQHTPPDCTGLHVFVMAPLSPIPHRRRSLTLSNNSTVL